MQIQNRNQKSEVGSQNEQPFGTNYSWADSKGRMHLGRSVGTGRDRAHAERRFFNQHKHVMREDGCAVRIMPLILAFCFLLVVIVIQAVQLVQTNRVIRENNASVEEQQARRMQYLQTNGIARIPNSVISNVIFDVYVKDGAK